MTQAPGWTGILEDGEAILWQGRTQGHARLSLLSLKGAGAGMLIALFSLAWIGASMTELGLFCLFGLPFLAIGLWPLARPVLLPAISARNSHYTLTNRRAFIATEMPLIGRNLNAWRIAAPTRADLIGIDDAGAGSVLFADGHFSGHSIPGPNGIERIGFIDIDDARKVWRLLREIQNKDQTA